MANLFSHRRRTRSSALLRCRNFGWIWCIAIKCFLSLPGILSSCHGVDISVRVFPVGVTKKLYGEPLEIFCIAENYTAEDLEFKLGGKPLESEIVNSTTRRLYIPKPEKQVNMYYCWNNKVRSPCAIRVVVDSVPANITDFTCISENLEKLKCSWTYPSNITIIIYELTFVMNGNTLQPCTVQEKDRIRYCEWNTSSKPRYKQMEEEFYFRLKSCNDFGCNVQHFTIDHFSIVKPDKPVNIKVLKHGSHSVLLKWELPINMDLLPAGVDHKIEYQIAKIDNTSYFRNVPEAASLPPKNKTYRFLLSNLPYAHMQYEVRVSIKSKKDVKGLYWSSFNYTVFYTASERPGRPPDMITGSFMQAPYETSRMIYVYWKQLEEYEEAGANFTYRVIVSQHGRNPQTIFPDKSKSLSYVILNEASLDALHVSVSSQNVNGSSVNSSHLYIPPKRDTENLNVPSFTKLAYENGTYKLSWGGIENIDNYTLFWCHQNNTKICAGRMNFTVLDPKKKMHVMDLPRNYRYQFAISANIGAKTSGMVWADCDIDKDGIPLYGFSMRVNHDIPGTSYVRVTWSMTCTLQEGIVTGYLITYCPVLDTSNVCDTTFGNRSVYVSDPKQMYKNITDLLPYTTYQFTLALNTTYGLKTIENSSTDVTTIEDTPSSPRDIKISNVTYNSMAISWDPPLYKNGIIRKYVIYDGDEEIHVEKVLDNDKLQRKEVTLTELTPFRNYTLTVQACNTAFRSCSRIYPNDAIFVRTAIGPPSRLKQPMINNNPDFIEWEPPTERGGTVDLYQIKRIKDNSYTEILNATSLRYSLTHCDGVLDSETYQVRAINYDEDANYGVLAFNNVSIPKRLYKSKSEYPGEWSEKNTVTCRNRDGITMLLISISVFALAGVVYAIYKFYKKYRKMEDIMPKFPNGLEVPEKDLTKYAYGGFPTIEFEKPTSDETSLLSKSKTAVSTPDIKQKFNDNCGSSDHTDSTILSDNSHAPVDRQISTSDDGSDSSLHLEIEPVKAEGNSDEQHSLNSESENSQKNFPYMSNKVFNKNASGYVQPVVNPSTGYVQSAPTLIKTPLPPTRIIAQPTTSSYVKAALQPPIFTTGLRPSNHMTQTPPSWTLPPSSGYVRSEDAQTQTGPIINFPQVGRSPTKIFGPESLPTIPTLPPPTKHGVDNSYIQLQSLDGLPSRKESVRNIVPLKPPATSGYVSAGDAVINKHLNNMLSAGQIAEESAILDPAMSSDAYCRFSWSTDPANDNLHSLLAESPRINSSKN